MNVKTLSHIVFVNFSLVCIILGLIAVSAFEMNTHHKQIESLELKHEVVVDER